jgi:phosphoglycerate dehydrogenase-like enzyme
MTTRTLLVALDASAENRVLIDEAVGGLATVIYLAELPSDERTGALEQADVVLSLNTTQELQPGEADKLTRARLIQFISAGVDFIPISELPEGIAVACNGGGYAEPMAEHAVAMALAAFKRLFVEHRKLEAGTFDQFRRNRMLAGSVCGILGFGGIGVATGRLMKALGAKVYAVNRRGASDEAVDWIGTTDQADELLAVADILVLSLPLTPATERSIGKRELELMKSDAVLINLARGEIIDEAALYAHLVAHPDFTACIDAWWVEPVRHGRFEMGHDFLSLPNVIGSPHNSASAAGWRPVAMRRALANIRRALEGDTPLHLVRAEDRML